MQERLLADGSEMRAYKSIWMSTCCELRNEIDRHRSIYEELYLSEPVQAMYSLGLNLVF